MAGALMAQDLEALESWIGGLVAKLSDGERRKLTRQIAVDLRRDQAQRIREQRNPDGSPFAPRKARRRPPLRAKTGRIQRQAAEQKSGPMFRKLRTGKYLGVRWTAEEAAAGFFSASAARIARVHQLGLKDKVSREPGAPVVTYPARVLLGFTPEYRGRLADLVLAHLQV